MSNKFLDSIGLGILWGRIQNRYISKEEFGVAVDGIQEYVDEKVESVTGGVLPTKLEIFCGNSTQVMD